MTPSAEHIRRICLLAEQTTGIQWDLSKDYLIESRITSRLENFGVQTIDELLFRLERKDPAVLNLFIDAVTTRETLFFRNESPFVALEHKALPEIIDAKAGTPFAQRLRIWSAACSSGQEPYSIAMTLMEMLPDFGNWDVQILATDISDTALSLASRGVYSKFEIERGLRPECLEKYFVPDGNNWCVCDEVRSVVTFEKCNLLEPFTGHRSWDVIFCRNVAIYFDLWAKRDLFERLAGVLTEPGCIFVGAGEDLSVFGQRWAPQFHCRSTYYQPNATRSSFSLQPKPAEMAIPSLPLP